MLQIFHSLRRRLPSIVLIGWALVVQPQALHAEIETQPRAVASILPLHSLLSAVMEGVAEPELLIEPAESPHKVHLRPSQAERLSRADLVVWIGDDLESGLSKSIRVLGESAQVLTLEKRREMELLPIRENERWEFHDHEDEEGHHHHGMDPHLWLSPRHAVRVVRALGERLGGIDPANADRYHANARSLSARLEDLDRHLDRRLEAVRDAPFLVFHDAYQYFERRYRLHAVGAVTLSPEQAPGARRIAELRKRIREAGARCVFAEPQFEPSLVRTLVEGTQVRIGELDPHGVGIAPGPEAYFQLLNRIADRLIDCLSP